MEENTEEPESTPEPTALQRVAGGTDITRRMRGEYDPEQVDLIRATVAAECNNAELAIFLETCARHQLDPFIKEIWAIKIKNKVQIFASRDGLLGIANRNTPEGRYRVSGNGQFLGCQSGVIREHDHFDFRLSEREDETEKWVVEHSPRGEDGKATHGGDDGSGRGKIVAGWARVRRKGHDDVFFMAYWKTYNQGRNAWGTHRDAMIQKCAESAALRKAFSISGIMGEGEMPGSERLTDVGESGAAVVRWPEDEEMTEKLKTGFGVLNWRRAKIRMTLNAVGMEGGDESYDTLLSRLHAEVDAQTAAEEENIQDADVVPDDEPAAA